jgi:hypothetical protein
MASRSLLEGTMTFSFMVEVGMMAFSPHVSYECKINVVSFQCERISV